MTSFASWDTSGKILRRVRVGETISYSSGKVPEPLDLARKQTDALRRRGIGPCNMYERLCVAATLELERLQEDAKALARRVEQLTDGVAQDNERWRRVWKAMEEKLEQAPLNKEPLEFWGGYRAALLDIRDFATRERKEGKSGRDD